MKILTISHGHPEISRGGAEIAAFNLHKEFQQYPEIQSVFLAGCQDKTYEHLGTPFSVYNETDVLWLDLTYDAFFFRHEYLFPLDNNFSEILENYEPDIVHLHHYFLLGLEIIQKIKEYSKNIPIILTLHEYMAICYNKGLMKKTNGELCYKAIPAECCKCKSKYSRKDYIDREIYIKSILEHVDHFISPSEFLKKRYIEWGLPDEKFTCIENGQVIINEKNNSSKIMSNINKQVIFSYLGQINEFKGIDILLKAISHLPKKILNNSELRIHGSNLENQSDKFIKMFNSALSKYNNIKYYGAYKNEDIGSLLNNTDWVIVPSTWWENSPLVIQEAFKYTKPVICSNIGGMAEKVTNNINGLHFNIGDPKDLANKITQVVSDQKIVNRLKENIKQPPTINQTAINHINLFKTLIYN